MEQSMSREEYKTAREKIEKMFHEEFFEKYYYKDATFRNCFEAVIRGVDPYKIIEDLIRNRQEMVDTIHNLTVSMTPSSMEFYRKNFLK